MHDDLCNLEICKKTGGRMMLPLILTIIKNKKIFSKILKKKKNSFDVAVDFNNKKKSSFQIPCIHCCHICSGYGV